MGILHWKMSVVRYYTVSLCHGVNVYKISGNVQLCKSVKCTEMHTETPSEQREN